MKEKVAVMDEEIGHSYANRELGRGSVVSEDNDMELPSSWAWGIWKRFRGYDWTVHYVLHSAATWIY